MWGWQCVGGWHCGGMVANVSYCGCCVCFFWVLLVASVVVWLSGFFFFLLWSVPIDKGRKRGKGREREREIVKKRIFK